MKKIMSVICCTLVMLTTTIYAQQSPNAQEWIQQGNIYEVNVRQYTPEGTFRAFEKNLFRLKRMGVQTLWFMPICPIGKEDRKGSLGSYYAISDYKKINPEYGSFADWKLMVTRCHEIGMKVIIDWVANHTSPDNVWMESHPDFYLRDSLSGKAISPFDWTDARKLNYNNPKLVDSMIAAMKFWIKESDIDGFRCDVAEEVPEAFWKKCITELRKVKPIFMLAEGEKPWLHKAGFNTTYTWSVFNVIKDIAAGVKPANSLDTIIEANQASFDKKDLRMYFTSNHDENSWNKADFGTTPGDSHAPFAVFTQTMDHSVPLIYSGQEEPFLRDIRFFDKDTITFKNYLRKDFYNKLLSLRTSNAALNVYSKYEKLHSNDDSRIFAYWRTNGEKKVLVVLNLSGVEMDVNLNDKKLDGKAKEIFGGSEKTFNKTYNALLKAWGYKVFVFE